MSQTTRKWTQASVNVVCFVVSAIMSMALIACNAYEPPRLPAANGDQGNEACQDAPCNVIGGYSGNVAADDATGGTISGGGQQGFPNRITGDFGAIGGGRGNQAYSHATVGGGWGNTASLYRATVGGGGNNVANGENATVSGGLENRALGLQATIGGGAVNSAAAMNATIGGGSGNAATGHRATVSGGSQNTARGFDSAVGGGTHNTASGTFATVAGGLGNAAGGIRATVAGGAGNSASGVSSSVGGGLSNRATDDFGTIGGGWANLAGNANAQPHDARYATVGGGLDNTASGSFATVPGGVLNAAASEYSFAAGRRARIDAAHPGTFLYADANDVDFPSAGSNEFAARATGGVRFVSAIDADGRPVAGVRLAPGSGAWSALSDASAKANVAQVDPQQILELLAQVPISTWSYAGQAASIRHIGPTAGDFKAVFGVGEDDRYISSVDADGVALAALQGLYKLLQERDAQIAAQEQQISTLEARVAALEDAVGQR